MSEQSHIHTNTLPSLSVWIVSMLSACWILVYFIFANEVPNDVGDGLEHFAIAKQAWYDDRFFLHHWGKPFFVLFASGFAQFGFHSYLIFNAVVFLITCFTARAIFNHFHLSHWLGAIFPWVLLAVPDYTECVIGGLTEPFFGCLVVVTLYLLLKEKWLLFACLCGCAPFARSEGMLVIVLAIGVLIRGKKYLHILFLAVPFVIYAIVGQWLIGNPWWYFTENPYKNSTIYGKGPWYTYIENSLDHFGLVTYVLLLFSIIAFRWTYKKWNKHLIIITLFALAIHAGIVIIHGYFWTFGLRSSLGLSRIATQGLPGTLVVLFVILGSSAFFIGERLPANKLIRLGFLWLLVHELLQLPFPNKMDPMQRTVLEASAYVKKHRDKIQHLFYFHPLVAYEWGTNTKAPNSFLKHHYGHLYYDTKHILQPGDYILRDSQFGAFEQGLQLDSIALYPWIVPVKHFYTDDIFSQHTNGEYKSVIVYRVMDRTRFDSVTFWKQFAQKSLPIAPKNTVIRLKKGEEFGMIDEFFPVPDMAGTQKLLCFKITAKKAPEETIFLVFDNGKGYYSRKDITRVTNGELALLVGKTKGKLYIHNPTLEPLEINVTPTQWKYQEEPGM